MKILLIINDAPYGTEKAYNALRIAMTFQREQEDAEIRIFLMSDAVTCALPDQTTPEGYYNIERMVKAIINKGGKVKMCGACMKARGLKNLKLIDGAEPSSMSELRQLIADSDKVISF
ncbi:MAG: DsrE/DsrF/TusD sulfur relay family protein [Promethearchaeota archaeon]